MKPLSLIIPSVVLGLILTCWLFVWPLLVKHQVNTTILKLNHISSLELSCENIQYQWPWHPLIFERLSLKLDGCSRTGEVFNFHTKELIIGGFSTWDYLTGRILKIEQVRVNHAIMSVTNIMSPNETDSACWTSIKDQSKIPIRIENTRITSSQLVYLKQLSDSNNSKWPIDIRFDSLSLIENLNVVYQEHVKEWDQPGQISFDSTRVSLPAFDQRKDRYLVIYTKGSFMNEAHLESEIRIPTQDSIYRIRGNLGPMRLTTLNPMLHWLAIPILPVGIQLHFLSISSTTTRMLREV